MDRQDIIHDIFHDIAQVRRHMGPSHRSSCSLSPAQGEVIAVIAEYPGLGITEIAQRMHTSTSAATQVVDALVAAGILTREVSAADRRAVKVLLSEEGKKTLAQFEATAIKDMEQFLSPLSTEELATLRDLHRKLI